jgi:uncharacterized protein (DUF1697 family)
VGCAQDVLAPDLVDSGRIVGVPTYAAFLRAINLGPTRKFPKESIVAATEAAGCTEVETYINTGNVRLTTPLRSRAKVEAALEAVYAEDRGFAVPTIVFTLAELRRIADDATDIAKRLDGDALSGRRHYVSLLKAEPSPEAAAGIEGLSTDSNLAVVRGRAVHLILGSAYNETPLGNAAVEKVLGVATNRNLTVISALAEKWV